MGIKIKTAYNIAIECILKERRVHAFTYHMGKAGITSPATRLAKKNYDRYTQAMEILQTEMEK